MARARRILLVVIVATLAVGAWLVIVSHPGPPTVGSATSRTEPGAVYGCLDASGMFGFGNLDAAVQDYRGELLGDVEIVPSSGRAGASSRPAATPFDRDRALSVFDACLIRTPFIPSTSAAGRGALLRLYQYHVTTYWPCLRAHGVDPGPMPSIALYVRTSGAARLVPFQSGFAGSEQVQMTAAAACAFEPVLGSGAPLPPAG